MKLCKKFFIFQSNNFRTRDLGRGGWLQNSDIQKLRKMYKCSGGSGGDGGGGGGGVTGGGGSVKSLGEQNFTGT